MFRRLTYKIATLLLIVFLMGVFATCSKKYYTNSEKWNLSAIYNPSQSRIHPSFKIYHNTDNSSLLFVKIYTSELLFQPLGQNGEQISDISINYTLVEINDDTKNIADSGTFRATLNQKTAGKYFLTQIPIKAIENKSYHLKLITRDKFRKIFNLTFLDVEKHKEFGQQYFNITQVDGSPLFKNVVIGGGALRILHPHPESDSLYISYYKNNTPLPKPTFAVGEDEKLYSKPDSLYIIRYSQQTAISLAHEGMYFIRFDTNNGPGVSLVKFNAEFPKIQTPKDLIDPLAYITTTGEYKKLEESNNKKLAADKYWIGVAGSTDRGKELIRIYYNRVYFSNYYFTTTQPGWKTDRGMIYIVYGPPHNLKKSADSETWYYYHNGGGQSISFTFDYSPGKYSINQYRLERSESLNWHWREAVYAWNNGEIFLQN